jgi:putative ABC transport system ATP-binding protein
MREMNQNLGTTFIFSTHDPEVLKVADHVVKIRDGIVEDDYRLKAVVNTPTTGTAGA